MTKARKSAASISESLSEPTWAIWRMATSSAVAAIKDKRLNQAQANVMCITSLSTTLLNLESAARALIGSIFLKAATNSGEPQVRNFSRKNALPRF